MPGAEGEGCPAEGGSGKGRARRGVLGRGAGSAQQGCSRGAVVEGRGVGPTKEATEVAEPGLRASWRAGGAPEVLEGSG